MTVRNITDVQIKARMWLNRRWQAGALAPPEVAPLTTTPISGQPVALLADRPTAPPVQPAFAPIELKGPPWETIATVFVKFQMDVPPTVEHLTEQIETALHRCSELKECKRLLCKAEETADGLWVDLCAINNEIQVPQHEANTGDADLQEAREEVAEALTTRDRETMQPNRNRMRLGELQDERKAVASFIKTIPSRLAAHNERFRDDLNTLVTTY